MIKLKAQNKENKTTHIELRNGNTLMGKFEQETNNLIVQKDGSECLIHFSDNGDIKVLKGYAIVE